MACREVLLTLHRKGLLDYPPPRQAGTNGIKRDIPKLAIDQTPIYCNLSKLEPIRIEMVRHTDREPLYNSLVDQFHYLEYSQIETFAQLVLFPIFGPATHPIFSRKFIMFFA
jgi:hypothetical protein